MDYSLKLLDVLDGSGILEVVDNTHAETDAEFLGGALQNAWVADHVFELNMLSLFFARNAGTRSGVNYDAIWNNLEQCDVLYSRASYAMNTVNNLVGIPGRINELKKQLLQGYTVDWTKWFECEIQALLQYFEVLSPVYSSIVHRLALLVDNIAYNGAGSSNLNALGQAGQTFVNWAQTQWTNAQAQMQAALANPATGYSAQASFANTYKKDELR
ncbi:hypothetical protein MMC09_006012 [Bachmanniomyces sp. S44760]|nr:hypothetical protein [Bachmanniomyces sp. S44760]